MSREQGPRMAGMRPSAIADGRRHGGIEFDHQPVEEVSA